MIFNPIVPKIEPRTVQSLEIGDSLWCNVNGIRTEFIVVNQGNPNTSLYDASCDGTWLLMKDIHSNRQWNTSNINTYQNSAINTWLNNDFLEMLDIDIKAAIKQVKIPYCLGNGGSTVLSGSSGMLCKIFLLSGYEIGLTTSNNPYFPVDGAKLAYFESGTGTSANNKRIANLNGSATGWWLRSPYTGYASSVWRVVPVGNCDYYDASYSRGIRPALVLPSDTKIDKDNNIVAPSEPETWVINNEPPAPGRQFEVSFRSNNQFFIMLSGAVDTEPTPIDGEYVMTGHIWYHTDETEYIRPAYYRKTGRTELACKNAPWTITWLDNAYKTVAFDSPVTDANLLTWLQANAVKQ